MLPAGLPLRVHPEVRQAGSPGGRRATTPRACAGDLPVDGHRDSAGARPARPRPSAAGRAAEVGSEPGDVMQAIKGKTSHHLLAGTSDGSGGSSGAATFGHGGTS